MKKYRLKVLALISFFWQLTAIIIIITDYYVLGFPGGSQGKESACNAGDPGSIPGLGRSPGEGNGYISQDPSKAKKM